jgi:hypothetical protein
VTRQLKAFREHWHGLAMPKRISNKLRDPNQIAAAVVALSTAEETLTDVALLSKVMAEMGREGGKIGGKFVLDASMDLQKVKDLISELEAEINVKVNAINALKSLLETSDSDVFNYAPIAVKSLAVSNADSYMNLTINAIESEGKPLHVKRILDFIRMAKGNPDIARRSVEATLIQHMKTKGEKSRVIKVHPGTYALRRYPRIEPAA